ncbi:hypothetical protein [Psychrobacillus sp. OK032]|nr:hypothetical protein [Psychrobacillus sp. OK032]
MQIGNNCALLSDNIEVLSGTPKDMIGKMPLAILSGDLAIRRLHLAI